MKKNILLNSDTSHLDLDHQSDCLFLKFRCILQLEILADMLNGPYIVSLSHCLEQLYSYLCKGKEETHATMLQRRPCTILKEDVIFFVYFLSACVLMRT